MGHILIVANETVGGGKLLRLVRARARKPDTTFTLIVPMTKPRSGLVIYDEAVRDSAQVRIDLAVSYLKGIGIHINGDTGDPDPYQAVLDAVDEYRPEEIIISTLPATSSGWLRRDLIERIQDGTGLPVTHVVTDIDVEGLPFEVTLVVANQTADDATLRARMRTKAAQHKEHLFVFVVPQSSGDGRAAAAARARLGNAVDHIRREGMLVAGMIGDPDPFTATMNALQFFHVDNVIISTLPMTRSGWMRGDLIERLRKAAYGVEIEHVVAERETVKAS